MRKSKTTTEAAAGADDVALLRGNATMLVLAILRDAARHGYDIAREVERRSDNTLSFNYGTLYTVLRDLEHQGLIAGDWEHVTGERSRRVYRLTEAGFAEMERSLKSWNTLTDAINRVVGGQSGEPQAA